MPPGSTSATGTEAAVFGDRYWSTRVDDDGHLLRAVIYVLTNPVAAGLVPHPSEWPWSSYLSLKVDGCSKRLAEMLGKTPEEARNRLLVLIDEAVEILAAERLADRRTALLVARRTAELGLERVGRG